MSNLEKTQEELTAEAISRRDECLENVRRNKAGSRRIAALKAQVDHERRRLIGGGSIPTE